ncbi:phenylalanine--tRNA ligase, alpha subunit [Mageeibacillus indolicus UPII9-5]|uniref:Phenylalanine--tRNA ligase alpha subunit n=3 Tax=Mageeibacillus indolicus TaxID=884684 RepID=D3R2H8_MAGIU|nr:phenylalanine--tRNA ligase, alpha subunit [Mageeibacillus indolicus UPII9-5]KFA57291.1 phenylalanine--tRNA ligase [Mageeibacillus indolicus 0009-5]PNH19868.1 phenylalanine--tRNA ligase subunit alpha [Mageeibacillus indolicus]
MSDLIEHLKEMRERYYRALESAESLSDLEAIRVKLLGKNGELTAVLRSMGKLSPEERPKVGDLTNGIRTAIEIMLNKQKNVLRQESQKKQMQDEMIDITMPGVGQRQATSHPISKVIEAIETIFIGMGYSVVEGPEVELSSYNFDRLRIPQGHPARSAHDTFYITDDVLLRTQTSPVQIRVMEQQKPPIKIIAPGKVYRPDTPDATHSPIFHQIEGLVVDKGVAMSDLVGTLKLFAQRLFGEDTQIRLRPHHFPFTEPSCEVDVTCWSCGGHGCRTCKGEGFVEVLGAGMVHPWVLEQSGIDPEIYSGFAFGIGVERTAMARFNIEDIRYFYENNLQFLRQFK